MQNWKQYHSKLEETLSKLDNLIEARAYFKSIENPALDQEINNFLTFGPSQELIGVDSDGLAKFFLSKSGDDYKYILDRLVKYYKKSSNQTVRQELHKVIEGGLSNGYYIQTLAYKILKFLGVEINKDNIELVRDIGSMVLSGKRTSKSGPLKGLNKLDSSLNKYQEDSNKAFYDYVSSIITSPVADMIKDDVSRVLFNNRSISSPEGGQELANDGEGSFEGIDVAQSEDATFEMGDYQANQLMKLGLDQEVLQDFIQAYRNKETPDELEIEYDQIGEDGAQMKNYYLKFIQIMNAKSNSSQESQRLRNKLSQRLRDKGEVGAANFFDGEVALKEKGVVNTQIMKNLLGTVGQFKNYDLLPYLKRGVFNVVVATYFQQHPELNFDDLSKALKFSSDNRTKYVTGIVDQQEYEKIIKQLHSLGANDIIQMLGFLTSNDSTYDNKTVEEILGNYSAGNVDKIRRVAYQRGKDIWERFLLDMTRSMENFSIQDIWSGLKSRTVKKSLEEDYDEEQEEKLFREWMDKYNMF